MVYQIYKEVIPPGFAKWFVVVILCILLDGASMVGFVRVGVIWVLTPILSGTAHIMTQGQQIVRYGQQLHQSARQNLDLQLQIDELRVVADRALTLEAENKELRSQLELAVPSPLKLIPARVVMRDSDKWRVSLSAQAGVGSMVFYRERVVGVVVAANGYVGVVAAIGGDTLAQLSVRAVDTNKSLGKVTKDGSTASVEKVTKEIELVVGDLLVTTGDDSLILPDYPVANITAIDSPPESVYQTLQLSPVPEIEVGELVWIANGREL